MRKWTTTNIRGCPTDLGSTLLSKILGLQGSLNPVECWALLAQTGYAIQDLLANVHGRRRLRRSSSNTLTGIQSRSPMSDVQMVTVYPSRIICTTSGKIILATPTLNGNLWQQFAHPDYLPKSSSEVCDRDLEVCSVYSLAQTMIKCLPAEDASLTQPIRALLEGMKRGQISLLVMLQTVSAEWSKLVGDSPISQFVSQLCGRTHGWNAPPDADKGSAMKKVVCSNNNDEVEVEFSKLESNSSGTPSPVDSPQITCKPLCSSSPMQSRSPATFNYGRRLDYRPSRLEPSTKKRRAVERNPSRLYRVVRPLTEISATPLPATKKCIGPEFIIRRGETPVQLDLYVHRSKREEGLVRNVTVIMLDGQQLTIRCNAASITAGEVLDAVLRERDIKESALFTLSCLGERGTEFWPLSSETKLSKVAAAGWKEGKPCQELAVYQRFKFHPEDVDAIQTAENKHLLYLQLRQDLLDGRLHGVSKNMYFSLAGMALQIEFGDFSEDIHGDGEYFMLEHYLPGFLFTSSERALSCRSLAKVHRAHLGQSQSKTELKFCREIMSLDCVGFHFFTVTKDKKSYQTNSSPSPNLIGIHVQGVFLYDQSKEFSISHKLLMPLFWRNIARIQYDKTRFQMTVVGSNSSPEDSKNQKLKFIVSETKAKLMFDLASSHHQHSNKLRYQAKLTGPVDKHTLQDVTATVEYKEPPRERAMRSLKSKFLSKRQLTQKKMYTQKGSDERMADLRANLKRSKTTNYLVKRLTHYSSMADGVVGNQGPLSYPHGQDLNTSDKENNVENGNYRYKFYLEPEEDRNPQSGTTPIGAKRIPLQERPIESLYPQADLAASTTSKTPKIATNPVGWRRRSDTLVRHPPTRAEPASIPVTSSVPRKSVVPNKDRGGSILRMGTQISMSVLHRERLRLTSEQAHLTTPLRTSAARKLPFSIDSYDPMESKSLLPTTKSTLLSNIIGSQEPMIYPSNESLSTSLIERFDQMETEESEPERQIVSVVLVKDNQGRLGLKITGTPSGIYIEDFDNDKVRFEGSNRLKQGDRLVAINGRSLENVTYSNALELVKKSDNFVQFLVSQIK